MKYVIIWEVIKTISLPFSPSVDEFGRTSMYVPSINLVETKTDTVRKEFDNEKDFNQFVLMLVKEKLEQRSFIVDDKIGEIKTIVE